jgi:glycine/D-amino acid oxidase-like deaminating enzyme
VARPPLTESTTADAVVVGGGYLGMWTAWHLLERDPNADVVILEAEVCGLGPSGRNGGFVNGYWDKLGAMVERFGEADALALAHAADRAVTELGQWTRDHDVDAWYRAAPFVEIATSAAQEGRWSEAVGPHSRLAPPGELRALSREEVQRVARSPRFGPGGSTRTAATVQPARLAFGLRRRLLERGVRIHERSPVVKIDGDGDVRVTVRGGATVTAGHTVVAVNHAAGRLRPFRRLVSTASSHIVVTPPVPEVLEQTGWTGGEGLGDLRTLLHYFRTTRDDRIVFGWGGGRMGYGTRRRRRLDVDPDAARAAARALERFFPALEGAAIDSAWGGPIDVSPIRLPQYRAAGGVLAGFGFTGNGVAPAHLGGRILSGMVLGVADEYTRLPLVEPTVPRFPPEPLRFVGATAIRAAMVVVDEADDRGTSAPLPARLLAGLPKRLGMSLPR